MYFKSTILFLQYNKCSYPTLCVGIGTTAWHFATSILWLSKAVKLFNFHNTTISSQNIDENNHISRTFVGGGKKPVFTLSELGLKLSPLGQGKEGTYTFKSYVSKQSLTLQDFSNGSLIPLDISLAILVNKLTIANLK
jgi:hypothetical protein